MSCQEGLGQWEHGCALTLDQQMIDLRHCSPYSIRSYGPPHCSLLCQWTPYADYRAPLTVAIEPDQRLKTSLIRFTVREDCVFVRAHSQIRKTVHPDTRSWREIVRSRRTLRASLVVQNFTRVFGILACRGHPCQKHPSIKMARRLDRKIKSGLPGSGTPRRQPVMPAARMSAMNFNSVDALPVPRTRDIRIERSAVVSVSATT
jgi:hypothetical protein